MKPRTLLPLVLLAIVAAGGGCSTDPEYAKGEYLKSGNRYFEQKKYREAAVQYQNALQQDPKFGEAHLQLARTYEALGDGARAVAEYIRAADALPGNADVQVKAGVYLILAGRFEEARSRAQAALKIDPKNVHAQVVLGNALSGLKSFDAALEELEEAARLNPDLVTAHVSMGALQLARGSREDAELAFRRAVQTNPKLPMAHMALANYLWATGRLADAEQSLKQALALDSGIKLARRGLVFLYIATGRPAEAEPHLKELARTDSSPASQLALADYYLGVNRPDDAMNVLRSVAQAQGGFAGATTREAMLEYSRKNSASAHKLIDEVLAKNPKDVTALLVKASFLFRDGKLDEATRRAREAAQLEPTSIQAHYLLGTIYRARRQPDEAAKSFNEVLRLNPRAAAAQVQLTQLNLAAGARQPALQLAQDAAKTLPRDPVVALNLVKALTANGDHRRAGAIMTQLLNAFPKVAEVHATAGVIALDRGDRAGARRELEAARKLDGDNFDALAGLVMADIGDKRIESARALVEARLSRPPEDPRVVLLAAQVYARAGDDARAEQMFRKALESDPSNLNVYGMLAQLYAGKGKLPEARAQLDTVIRAKPDAVGARTLAAVLDQVMGKSAEARQGYEQVLQMEPNAAVAANNLAYMYAEQNGNLDLALQYAQVAKQQLPNVGQVNDTLGWVYVKRGMPALALPLFEQASKQAPRNAAVVYHTGIAYSMLLEKQKARASLEQALRMGLGKNDAEQARKALASLGASTPAS